MKETINWIAYNGSFPSSSLCADELVLLEKVQDDLIERRRIFQTAGVPGARNNVMFRAGDSGAHFLAAL